MKRLTQKEAAEKARIAALLGTTRDALDGALFTFNERVSKLWDELLTPALAAYDEARDAARAFRDEVTEQMQCYQDDRAEKWHDSDAGSTYREWQAEWEDLDCEPLELEQPDAVEMPDVELPEEFEALSEELAE